MKFRNTNEATMRAAFSQQGLVRSLMLSVFLLATATISFAQLPTSSSQPGGGTRRNFTLYGDINIQESVGSEQRNVVLDVILYTRGNEVFSRQRVGNGGRYRFNNVFNGDYYLAIELDSAEIARMPILISANSTNDIRQDLAFQWKSRSGVGAGGVVSAADAYSRSGQNKSLYLKASQEIASKKFNEAIVTLKSLVATDPKDFPAWADLGMVYFIQKDLEAAENSYTSALAAKPDHLAALVNLGRVRLARKNNEGAIETLEQALKVDSKSASVNYFLGEAYLGLKKGSKAVGFFYEALNLDPVGMADAHLRLASLYNLAGYKDKAAVEYEQFLKKKPDYAERKKLEEYIQANKR